MPWNDMMTFHKKMTECGVKFKYDNLESWVWFNGDLNEYYNKLIKSDSKRDPNDIKTYAVHRWMGKQRSTLIHYELIYSTIQQYLGDDHGSKLRLLDAGCGLGAGLMWFERNGLSSWELTGHTISSEQLAFINKLPTHNFNAVLKSYDDLDTYVVAKKKFHVIYALTIFINNLYQTLTPLPSSS